MKRGKKHDNHEQESTKISMVLGGKVSKYTIFSYKIVNHQ